MPYFFLRTGGDKLGIARLSPLANTNRRNILLRSLTDPKVTPCSDLRAPQLSKSASAYSLGPFPFKIASYTICRSPVAFHTWARIGFQALSAIEGGEAQPLRLASSIRSLR